MPKALEPLAGAERRTPLVSVALATHNGERFLRQQLETIYSQTWTNLEVVANDDASSDGTVSILEEFSATHGLRYQISEHRGLVGSFERALSRCTGALVAPCDQDDLWKPHRIARLVEAIGDATLVYCRTDEQLGLDGQPYLEPRFAATQEFSRRHGSGRPTKFLLAENWIVGHSMLFRRDLLDVALPIPRGQRFHDEWLALVASTMNGVKFLDERLQLYRNHPGSYTFRRSEAAPPLLRFVSGGMAQDWNAKCAAELERLGGTERRLTLSADEIRFLETLRSYYRRESPALEAVAAGWRIGPYLANHDRSLKSRLRAAVRPLVARASSLISGNIDPS